jgi:hypothetical protein
MAAIRCLTGFRILVAIAIALRNDLFAAAFRFFADFAFLAVLRFVAMVPISSCKARQNCTSS